MVVGSYLFASTHMRIKDERGVQFIGLPNGPPPNRGRLTPRTLKERVELVFQMAPEKMKRLVIINSNLSYFEMLQACLEIGDKYAENVMIIPPLLALLTYAFEDISKFRNPPPKEVLLVVTLTSKFVEFVILRRDENFKLYVAEFEHSEVLNQLKENFSKFYDYCYPHSTILVVQETLYNIAENIRREFKPENCFIKSFKKYDFVLLLGGIFRAMDDDDGFDTRYHIENFSSGYETTTQIQRSRTQQRQILLPARSSLPCNIHGFNGIGQMVNVYYSPEYYQSGDDLISTKRPAIKHAVFFSGSSKEIVGYVDERGVPYTKNTVGFKNLESSKMTESEKQLSTKVNSGECISASDSGVFSQPSSSSTSNSSEIKFLFRDNFYAVQVIQNGSFKNVTGDEWTPLYLSMAEDTVKIGETAKIDYEKFPKYVIYDALKIIGKSLEEIIINPKWGFELTVQNGNVHFQVETPSGPRLIPQEIVISAFLKAMKLQTESLLDTQIKEIRISTNFELTESQKVVFKKAAAKNNLEILHFDLNYV